MTIEISPETQQKFDFFKKHETRRQEKRQIAKMGSLWAATRASILLLNGCSAEDCIKSRIDFEKKYYSSNRKGRITLIKQTNDICDSIWPKSKPNYEGNSYAYQARALTLLSKIITAGITEGDEAVMVTGLLMGSHQLQIDQMGLVVDWKDKQAI